MEWISVKDKRPVGGSFVLVKIKEKVEPLIRIGRYGVVWTVHPSYGAFTITHWTPLPESPK